MKKINGVELNDYELFVLSRWTYSIGSEIIPNEEYNELLRLIKKNYPENEYVNRSWSSDPCPVDLCKKVNKPEWISSVILGDKTESIASLNTWNELESTLHAITGPGTLSMKLDGWNTQFNYYNGKLVSAQSRGRSSDVVDLPKLASKVPQEIPVDGKVRVCAEATVSDDNFAKCVRLFGNVSQRSAVSSVLARAEDMSLIDLHAHSLYGIHFDADKKFDILKSWGFNVPAYYKVSNYEELKVALKSLSDTRERYGHPTDGTVYWGQLIYAIRLMAWEEPLYYSFVKDYKEEFSAHRINPRIEIYPIIRNGGTQRMVNITNWQRIINCDLRIGSPIAFKLVSESIADIDEESTRRLHEEWKGHEDVFREQVTNNEETKRMQRAYLQMG